MDINQYSEQYFKFISDHFINTIATQVNHKVLENIAIEVNKFNIAEQINQQIDHVVANAIAAYRSADLAGAAAVGQNLVAQFKTESENFIQQLTADVRTKVIEEYRHKVHEIDIVEMIKDQCNILVKQAVETGTLNFPHNSIPSSAIQAQGYRI
jgi:secreted PhoX family phosphatase